jgi:uncharacterized protein VirK/YbjX
MNYPITLRSGLRSELDGLAYLRESLKLTVRALLYRRQTGSWLQLLNSHPLFAQMLPACPRLVNKIYRSYFSTRLRCQDRLDLLHTHYDVVIGNGLAPLVARAAHRPVTMCRLQARSPDSDYRIELRAGGVLCREGELVLQLMHGAALLVSVAFSFLRQDGGIALGIGCLQGAPGGGGLDAIRSATRDLHGMRPKQLLVRMVRQFGHDLGCAQLVLVGNRNRVVTTSMRQGKVHADYDGLWLELNAVRRADGNFGLACEDLPQPRMEEIASKKRSEARKRHEMLLFAIEAVRAQVVRSQCTLAPPRLVHLAAAAPMPLSSPAHGALDIAARNTFA